MPSLSWLFHQQEKSFQQHSALVVILFLLSLPLSHTHFFYPEYWAQFLEKPFLQFLQCLGGELPYSLFSSTKGL